MSSNRKKKESARKAKELRKRIDAIRGRPRDTDLQYVPDNPVDEQREFQEDTEHLPESIRDGRNVVIQTPKGMKKISEAMSELLMPYLDSSQPLTSLNVVAVMGVLAWNYTCADRDKMENLIRSTIQELPADIQPMMVGLVAALIERKLQLFPNDMRIVIHTSFREYGKDYRIVASCAVDPKDYPPEMLPNRDSR